MKKSVWFDARELKNENVTLPKIFNLNYSHIILRPEKLKDIETPKKMKIILYIGNEKIIDEVKKDMIIMSENHEYLIELSNKGYETALLKAINNKEDMDSAWVKGQNHNYLLLDFKDETNIPLELLIARLQSKKTSILKLVSNSEEAEIVFGVMEVGSDGVVLKSENLDEIIKLDKLIEKQSRGKLELVKAKVTDMEHIGMGYRACIDTTTIMSGNEGMIIGSTSSGGLLVSSETHFLPYMELRPFRVNAGAVHSYVWGPNNSTAYLSELKAGSRLLCVNTLGETREVSVGRVKIEVRPLLKIEVEYNNIRINAIVQDDWHIRLLGGDGQPKNASKICIGDELLAYMCLGGRHVGIKIDESIEEK